MDPTGTIADYAAVGAVLGAATALVSNRKEMLTEWMGWGLVWGAGAGVVVLIWRAVA